ncbi:MAG: hypothetical protein ACREPE_08915 [Lysobacter sp.]
MQTVVQQNDARVSAKALYDQQCNTIHVTNALLEDLVYLYASQAITEDESEAFVERMADDDYRAVIRQIFCRACLGVNAAVAIEDEAVFNAYVAHLELPDLSCNDEVLAQLLRYTLSKLGQDAGEGMDDSERLVPRLQYLLLRA